MRDFIEDYFNRLKSTVDNMDREEIEKFVHLLLKAEKNEQTIFTMGNGGSGSTASHFIGDIAKGIKGKNFKVICLNDSFPILMAYANDMSYDDIFVEQLKPFFKKGDVVIGFSTSGNSRNIIKAIEFANENGGETVGFTGYDGGKLKQIAKYSINANINEVQVSEDVHLAVVHMIMQFINKQDKDNGVF